MISHLSYSSVKDACECPYRFKLRQIDKIRSFQNTIHTIFGDVMHGCIQTHLQSVARSQADTAKLFKRKWGRFCKLYRKHLDFELVRQYLFAGLNVIKHINEAFDGYALIAVEQKIMQPIDAAPHVSFKGYIDLVMDRAQRIVIADLKTAKNVQSFKRYTTPLKKYQLAFYKHFFAKQFEMSPDDIDLMYIVLEKDPASKTPIHLLPVSFTEKKALASLQVLNNTVNMVEQNNFPKNRSQCRNEFTGIQCPFFKTEHCT